LFPGANAPVVVGGVGGSGTRLIAQLLMEVGHFLGYDLNQAKDNLLFTLLFKREAILSAADDEFDSLLHLFIRAMLGQGEFTSDQISLARALANEERPQHPAAWLNERFQTLLAGHRGGGPSCRWGWKEPNSHLVLDRLVKRLPGMKYIHVARNGLDMAFSQNQNQLKLWGKYFIDEPFEICPHFSLKYWRRVHERVLPIGESMRGSFYFLHFDQLCADPQSGIAQLLGFLGMRQGASIDRLAALVQKPESLGRFRTHGLAMFAEEDVAYVRSLGFPVDAG
jgi:hypothetical protein